jgi:hypothetical protein
MYIPAWIPRLLTPEWLTAVGTVGTVVIALILAVWGEEIKGSFVRPKLSLKARVGRPYSEKTVWRGLKVANPASVYYFRLAIQNRGNTAAHDVQVFLASIERVTAAGLEDVSRFAPMNLNWSYRRSATLPVLLPHMPPVFCDVGHVTDPLYKNSLSEDLPGIPQQDAVLALDVEFPPNTGGHLLRSGTYRLHLVAAAANAHPRRYKLEVVFCGKWFDEEEKMFDVGLRMQCI